MDSSNLALSQLESHLWEAANILRGPVDAADFKTYVFPLLFFKRISDVHDEEYRVALEEAGGDEEYALWQHILLSLAPKTGRCAILFPHGVLFRQEEADMRRKLIEADVVECVLGLGPNLFYNSPMEACVVICRASKPKARRNKILFINAVGEVTRERAQSFLTDDHIEHIVKAYEKFKDESGFTRVATLEEIRAKDGNLSIPLYVAPQTLGTREERAVYAANGLPDALSTWLESSNQVRQALKDLLPELRSK